MVASWVSRALSVCIGVVMVFGWAQPTSAQVLGAFTWQMQPYCNVFTFTVTYDGAGFRLTGFDDQCGAFPTRLPAAGVAVPNPDGTYALSLFTVTYDGLATHVRAVLNPASISGPWVDNAGGSGTFAFGVPSPAAGSQRPSALVSSVTLADNAVTAPKVAVNAIDSARIVDGSVTFADLANDSVSGAKLQLPLSRSIASVSDAFAITNTSTGEALAATNSSSGTALSATNSGTGGGISVALSNAASGARAIDVSHSGVGPGVYASSTGGIAVWGITSSISAAGVIGDNTNGEAVVGRNSGGAGVGAVVGRNNGAGYGVRGFNTVNGVGVLGQAGISGGTGTAGRFENVNAASTADVLVVTSTGTGDLIQASQSGNVRFRVTAAGAVQADLAYASPAADVAEFIDSFETLEAGDVVEIDSETSGQFRLAARPSSTAVAGVITTRPGVLLNVSDERNDVSQGPALALAGRIPVKVSAENGAIVPGDLLVASSTPGHAMKAPANPAPGTVVGKALGRHEAATGRIEMLVMLR